MSDRKRQRDDVVVTEISLVSGVVWDIGYEGFRFEGLRHYPSDCVYVGFVPFKKLRSAAEDGDRDIVLNDGRYRLCFKDKPERTKFLAELRDRMDTFQSGGLPPDWDLHCVCDEIEKVGKKIKMVANNIGRAGKKPDSMSATRSPLLA